MTQSFIPVTLQIPTHRHADFHRMIGDWLAEGDDPEASLSEWLTANDADLEIAKALWDGMSTAAHKLFTMLMEPYIEALDEDKKKADKEGRKILTIPPIQWSASDLADKLETTTSGIAGTLSWPLKRAVQMGRVRPVRWMKNDEGTTIYWIPVDVAVLFMLAAGMIEKIA